MGAYQWFIGDTSLSITRAVSSCLVQVESSAGVEAIPEIAEVDGVDGIFLGPFDLSASLGKMGQFEEGGEVSELIERQT